MMFLCLAVKVGTQHCNNAEKGRKQASTLATTLLGEPIILLAR
jgi:hypothetical protein